MVAFNSKHVASKGLLGLEVTTTQKGTLIPVFRASTLKLDLYKNQSRRKRSIPYNNVIVLQKEINNRNKKDISFFK